MFDLIGTCELLIGISDEQIANVLIFFCLSPQKLLYKLVGTNVYWYYELIFMQILNDELNIYKLSPTLAVAIC